MFKGLTENHPVASFNEFMTLYAELIPIEELETEDACFTIACFHFDKEPTKTHNVPFYFIVKEVSISYIRQVLSTINFTIKKGRILQRNERTSCQTNWHQSSSIPENEICFNSSRGIFKT